MKKISVLFILLLLTSFSSLCQQFQKPADGKTLVYFVRFQGAVAVIDFKYFDGEKYLGRVSGNNYFLYECEPGEHVFWLAAENREYIRGNLKPNCTYVIEVRPYMRAIMAGVELNQISPTDKKTLKKISILFDRKKPVELKGQEEDLITFIESGIERYKKIETEVTQLNSEWSFND